MPHATIHIPLAVGLLLATYHMLHATLSKGSYRYFASLTSGLLLFLCFPLPNWNASVWVALTPLLLAVMDERRLWHAFLFGYLGGAMFLAGSCYWFVYVMERHGGLGPVLAIAVLLLFVIVFSAFFGAYGLAVAWISRRSQLWALALAPFLWVAMEIARTYLITGFPWNLLGYAVQPIGLERLASVTGVYGLSFLAAGTSALTAWAAAFRDRRSIGALGAWASLLVVANWLFTPAPLPPGSVEAVLVQPDAPLNEAALQDWAPWKNPAPLDRLVAMSIGARLHAAAGSSATPLIIWSENPAPFYWDRDPVFHAAMVKMARDAHANVVAGTVTFLPQDNGRPRNSAIVLDAQGRELLQYDKIHLVPFGEYVPDWAFPGKIGKITLEVGDFVPGSNYDVARTSDGAVGVFICYEAIFPQLVRRINAQGATVLVTISDDTWFGKSSAAFQHLNMARLRAIENGRYLLRATNDGVTAVIDPYGRVLNRSPMHQAAVLTARFDHLSYRTFYTAQGDVFAWACVAIAALGVLIIGFRETRTLKPKPQA